MTKSERLLAYAAAGGALYWFLFRPKAAIASPAGGPPALIPSTTTGPVAVVGNPNNLINVATPDEMAQMYSGGGSEF